MLKEMTGDILQANTEALVNTVNTKGVMGKGLALQFKQAYPEMFKEYKKLCDQGELQIGKVHVYERGGLQNPRYIINFPTKRHWREKTKPEYIHAGLQSLVEEIQNRHIRSIALPALGSGLGGLDWEQDVYPAIQAALGEVPEIEALIYRPQVAPQATRDKVEATPKPEMTLSHAVILRALQVYPILGEDLTLLEVHKILYFLQEAGEPLNLRFEKLYYGPYADNLRFLFDRIDGHFIQGFVDNQPTNEIQLLPEAVSEAERMLDEESSEQWQHRYRLQHVLDLIYGFETPYGMELLATVHWVAKDDPKVTNPEKARKAIAQWSKRKKERFAPEDIKTAWYRLLQDGWLDIRERMNPEADVEHTG